MSARDHTETQPRRARIRVRYLSYHNPKVWAAFYDNLAPFACLCHSQTLEGVWREVEEWFLSEAPAMIEAKMAEIDARLGRAIASGGKQ